MHVDEEHGRRCYLKCKLNFIPSPHLLQAAHHPLSVWFRLSPTKRYTTPLHQLPVTTHIAIHCVGAIELKYIYYSHVCLPLIIICLC